MVLDLHRTVQISYNLYSVAMTSSRFIGGVGQDLKETVDTAFEIIRTEDYTRTLPDSVRSLEHRYTVVIVL
jgi:hypothetical protein